MFLCDNIRCLVASQNVHENYVVSPPGLSIKQCTACKQSNYCSKECQREAMANGHRFSCQQLLVKAAGKRTTRLKLFRGIQNRFEAATLLDKKGKFAEIAALQDSLLGDADALVTSTGNEFVIFRIYDMLSRVHQSTKNVHESHRFNLMTKYIADRMDSSFLARMHKTAAYISVGQTSLVIGEASQSIALHTKCLEFCLDHPNEQRHLWTKIAHGSLELGQYQECIDQVKYAITIPLSPLAMVTPNLPPIHVEVAGQLLLLAQCNLALCNYRKALLFHKLLWHYSKINNLHDYRTIGQSGIASVICAQAHHNLAKARDDTTLATLDTPNFATRLHQARVWYMKGDNNENGGLYACTFLRLAFLEYHLAKYHGTLHTQIACGRLLGDAPTTEAISRQNEQLNDIRITDINTQHNRYLVKYLKHQIKIGNQSCSFCEQSRFANDNLLMCSGCNVVRFCNKQHQKLASTKMSTFSGRYVIRHHSVCKLLRHYAKYLANSSVENAQSYLHEQNAFLDRGL